MPDGFFQESSYARMWVLAGRGPTAVSMCADLYSRRGASHYTWSASLTEGKLTFLIQLPYSCQLLHHWTIFHDSFELHISYE